MTGAPPSTKFIAIDCSAWSDAITTAAANLEGAGLRVVPPGSHHITIAHLGRPPASEAIELAKRIAADLTSNPVVVPITLAAAGVGQFRSSVLYISATADKGEALGGAAEQARQTITDVTGRCPSQDFVPHVTVALRQRKAEVTKAHRAALAAAWDPAQVHPLRIDAVHLMTTDRTTPRWYESLASLPL